MSGLPNFGAQQSVEKKKSVNRMILSVLEVGMATVEMITLPDCVSKRVSIKLCDYLSIPPSTGARYLSRDGNLHGSGTSHSPTASPKPSFRKPWRAGRGRQMNCWMDNIEERASLPMSELLKRASRRKDWKRISY